MEYRKPSSLAELKETLAGFTPKSRVIGGGTDLVIEMRKGEAPDILLSPEAVPEFQRLNVGEDTITIGAGVSVTRLHRVLNGQIALGALLAAARNLGSEQIRNRATIGGNAAKASPSGDLIPVLRLLEATVRVISPDGPRLIPFKDFIIGPGRSVLKRNEIIESFTIKRPGSGVYTAFAKVGSRAQVTIARINLALLLELDGFKIHRAEVVLGAVAETPVRAAPIEELLTGQNFCKEIVEQAATALSQHILHINHRPNREYKAWAGPGALFDACRAIKEAAGLMT